MLDLTALEAAVTEDESVTNSATTVIAALLAEIEASKTDPTKIQAIVDRTRAATGKLAAAIATVPPAV